MKVFQLNIGKHKYSDFFIEITQLLQKKTSQKSKAIFTPNPEICLQTLEDTEFLQVLQKADYLTSDGIGLYLAYQINSVSKMKAFFLLPYFFLNIFFRKGYLYKKYGERICGSDITSDLVSFCEVKKIHVAILDPYFPNDEKKCEAQDNFIINILKVFPELRFDFYIYREEHKQDIFQKIQDSKAQVVFSTLGMKKQEVSILEVLDACSHVRLGLAIGSSFDYFTGFQKRAPELWRKTGFEWLYRIFTSPRKLNRLKRIYKAVIIFPIKVLSFPVDKK